MIPSLIENKCSVDDKRIKWKRSVKHLGDLPNGLCVSVKCQPRVRTTLDGKHVLTHKEAKIDWLEKDDFLLSAVERGITLIFRIAQSPFDKMVCNQSRQWRKEVHREQVLDQIHLEKMLRSLLYSVKRCRKNFVRYVAGNPENKLSDVS